MDSAVSFAGMRATDADRLRIVDRLAQALQVGSVTVAEFEQRSAAASCARTHGELAALTADLPVAAPDPAPDSRPAGPLASRIRGLHAVTAIWLLTSLALVVIWALVGLSLGHLLGPWPLWVIGPTGAALATL